MQLIWRHHCSFAQYATVISKNNDIIGAATDWSPGRPITAVDRTLRKHAVYMRASRRR